MGANSPLVFGSLFGQSLQYVGGHRFKVKATSSRAGTAICSQVMRAGKHFALFQLVEGHAMCVYPCIIRPIKQWGGSNKFIPLDNTQYLSLIANDNGRWGDSNVNVCTFRLGDGECICSSWQSSKQWFYGDK